MDLAGAHGNTESAFLGTASAPVSRTNTRTPADFVADLQAEQQQQQNHPANGNGNGNGGSVNGSSGSSSGATAVHHSPSSLQSGTMHNGVHNRDFAAASTGGGGGGHAPETHLSLPQPQTEEQLRRALGSASAPASPGGGLGHGLEDAIHQAGLRDGVSPPAATVAGAPGSGLPRSSSDPRIEASTSTASEQGMNRTHHDPAVAAGLLDPSLSEPAGQVPPSLIGASPLGRAQTADPATTAASATPAALQQQPRQRRHHHHNSPYNSYGQENYYAQQGGGYGQHTARGLGHQNSHHSKPVFSLARPLPTREQRDLQKAYRDGIKHRTGAGKSAHAHSHAHGPTIGPGGRHPQAIAGPGAFGAAPLYGHPQHSHQVMGPGAHHPTGPVAAGQLEPGFATGRPFGEHDQLVAMLRQLLDAQKADDKDETGTKVGAEDEKDVRVDDPDAAMKRKEKFGQNEKDSKAKKTAKAERRDSMGSDSSSSSSSSDDDEEEEFPNPFARFRHAMREPFAEYLGTMLLVMFGTGVSLQYFLSLDPNVVSSPRGTYLSVSFGWGIGVGMGVWVAGGISGGHINPAVTLALAVFRGFPWKKVPGYMLAQVLGSMTGAGLNYAMYRRAISIYEGGGGIRTVTGDTNTASLFATYPLEYLTDANAFFSEFINTAVLLIVVLAISDSNNAAPPDGLNPLVLMFLVVGIGACFGMQTAYCINPARDLGPRLVTWFAGYSTEVWNFRNQYWLWVPWLATLSGGLMGALIYDTLIYTGSESPCNMKWDWPWRERSRESFGPASKAKMPLGQTEA